MISPWVRQRQAHGELRVRLRIFYGLGAAWILGDGGVHFGDWQWIRQPLWPVAWFPAFLSQFGEGGLRTLPWVLGGLALLPMAWPEKRVFRIAGLVAVLTFGALESSLGKVSHHFHGWIWIAFLWLFLPQEGRTRPERQMSLNTWRLATVCLVGFYFLAGLWKIAAGVDQWWAGGESWFHWDAMARHGAFHNLTEARHPVLADWWISRPWLSGGLGWVNLGVTLLCPLVLRRPRWLAAFALYVAFFHLLTGLVFEIWYLGSAVVGLVVLFPLGVLPMKAWGEWSEYVRQRAYSPVS